MNNTLPTTRIDELANGGNPRGDRKLADDLGLSDKQPRVWIGNEMKNRPIPDASSAGQDGTQPLAQDAPSVDRAAHHDDLVERALAAEACEPKRVKMPTLKRISTWDEARFGCTQEQAEEIVTAARVLLARGAMHAVCARRASTAADDGRTRDAAKFNAEADHWRREADEATAALAKAVRDAEPVDACPHCGAPVVDGVDHGSGGSGDAEPPEVPSIACSRHDEGCTYRV